jgi:FMNH2-dependent dimethyl sulfone monooxygenase
MSEGRNVSELLLSTFAGVRRPPAGRPLRDVVQGAAARFERLGLDFLLFGQRWWGTGEEIEASTNDSLAMTAMFAGYTDRARLITAVHPGFFLPAAIAKWGATIDNLSGGRWSPNITSGWHEREFPMYGVGFLDHDDRYARSGEFIDVLRGAWEQQQFSYSGDYYRVEELRLEPRPTAPLTVFQGGQSPAAIEMGAERSDWMFINGGPPDKIAGIIEQARAGARERGRELRFAMWSIPLCRETDAEAEAEAQAMVDELSDEMIARKRAAWSGAEGMWRSEDPLALIGGNEGYASRLIGSPQTIVERMLEFHRIGVDCFHVALRDQLFVEAVLPRLKALPHEHR